MVFTGSRVPRMSSKYFPRNEFVALGDVHGPTELLRLEVEAHVVDPLEVHVRVELVVDARGESLPLWDLGVRLGLADGVAVDRPTVLAWVREEAVGVDGLLVGGRRGEPEEDRPALGEVLQNPVPLPEIGAVALVQDHDAEVILRVAPVLVANGEVLDGRDQDVAMLVFLRTGSHARC